MVFRNKYYYTSNPTQGLCMNEKQPFCYTTRRKRRRITKLYKDQKGLCIYCKKQMWLPWSLDNVLDWDEGLVRDHNRHVNFKARATLEHKKALTKGGSKKRMKNLACSCSECNGKKGSLPHHIFAIVHKSDTLYKLTKEIRRLYHRYKNSLRATQKRRRKAYS